MPVKAIDKVAEPPLQMVANPLTEIALVGRELTVTRALPVMSAAIAVHLESESADTVYVFVVMGDTDAI